MLITLSTILQLVHLLFISCPLPILVWDFLCAPGRRGLVFFWLYLNDVNSRMPQ